MTDQLITQTTEELTGADQVSTEKKFTQAELDATIKSRLEREKTSHKTTLSERETALSRATTELETSNQIITRYKTTMSTWVNKQLENVPEGIKELVAKLDIDDQLEWLEKHGSSLTQSKQSFKPLPDNSLQPGDETLETIAAKKRPIISI